MCYFSFLLLKNNYYQTSIRVFCPLYLFLGNYITSLVLYDGYHKFSSLKWGSFLVLCFLWVTSQGALSKNLQGFKMSADSSHRGKVRAGKELASTVAVVAT